MAYETYSAVTNENQGTFNNPRQKMWGVFKKSPYWTLELTTNSFEEAKEQAKKILCTGGVFTNINNIMVVEIVPIDTVITPSV